MLSFPLLDHIFHALQFASMFLLQIQLRESLGFSTDPGHLAHRAVFIEHVAGDASGRQVRQKVLIFLREPLHRGVSQLEFGLNLVHAHVARSVDLVVGPDDRKHAVRLVVDQTGLILRPLVNQSVDLRVVVLFLLPHLAVELWSLRDCVELLSFDLLL